MHFRPQQWGARHVTFLYFSKSNLIGAKLPPAELAGNLIYLLRDSCPQPLPEDYTKALGFSPVLKRWQSILLFGIHARHILPHASIFSAYTLRELEGPGWKHQGLFFFLRPTPIGPGHCKEKSPNLYHSRHHQKPSPISTLEDILNFLKIKVGERSPVPFSLFQYGPKKIIM